MKTAILSLITLTFLAYSGSARAEGEEGTTNKVDQRQANQEKRIEQGVQSGELTKREAKRLEHTQKRIGKVEERAESDGTVTKKEARHLNKMQNHASQQIRRQKHDRKRR